MPFPFAYSPSASFPHELLASLSTRPQPTADLMHDLGFTRADMRFAMEELAVKGIEVRTCRDANGCRAVYVPRHCWLLAREAAEAYWDRIYPEAA